MRRSFKLGRLANLEVSAEPSAVFGTLLLWGLFSGAGSVWLHLSPGKAAALGLLLAALHWGAAFLHQFGHAWAARRTGYPMQGVRLWIVLDASVYPSDEPALPAQLHIRRALGGPVASLLSSLSFAILALGLRLLGGWAWGVCLFLALDCLLVFTLGSLLPLGFTDGSTLLTWWGK